ncbi:MAG: DNA cytosine methyltransferase [Actinobacteria bacterium]|nr:DNA cytosine methyltransferase [Actinomycetota bacterium]
MTLHALNCSPVPGGASVGLRDAGFHSLLAVEWDKNAAATHRAALPCPVFEGDVRKADLSVVEGPVDLLWSSPPCQAWSTAGRRLGAFDDRNGWPWTLGVVDRLASTGQKPTWVICENVLGLIMHRNGCPADPGSDPTECPGCYWERWVQPEFRRRYPHVSWRVLNSADYGVPQRRRRVFLVAGPDPFPWPAPTHSFRELVRSKWVDGSYWARHGIQPPVGGPSSDEAAELGVKMFVRDGTLPWVTIRDAVGMGATAVPDIVTPQDGDALDMFGDGDTTASVNDSVEIDLPSDTLAAQTNGRAIISASARRRAAWTEQTGRQKYTVEECCTLQGFPVDHPFRGAESLHYKQIGNAVSPPVAEALGLSVVKMVRT